MNKSKSRSTLNAMVSGAILAAVVVVLQMIVGAIKVGPFAFTLSLVPIVVGAALYGPGMGAFLGGVFGLITFIGCATGTDQGGNLLFQVNPFLCALVCFVKGIASGFCAGLMYRLCARKSGSLGRKALAVVPAAIVSPVVNTGLFCLGMALFFRDTLNQWAGGQNVFTYMLLGLAGVNFLIETGINLVLSPGIATVIEAVRKRRT